MTLPSNEPTAFLPEHLTVLEAVEHSRLSRSTIYNLLKADGGLKSVNLCRPGYSRGRRFIRRADLLAFLDGASA